MTEIKNNLSRKKAFVQIEIKLNKRVNSHPLSNAKMKEKEKIE